MAANPDTGREQDVDLFYVLKKIGNGFDRLGYEVFKFLRLLYKNKWALLGAIAAGIIMGFILDGRKKDIYKNEIIIVPNFNSVNYLYDQVHYLDMQDMPITSMKIEPIPDIYTFVQEKWNNLELAKHLKESNISLNKYKENSNLENLYRYHLLTIYTDTLDAKGTAITQFLDILNSDPYFLERQKIEQKSLDSDIEETKRSIEHTNKILEKLGDSESSRGEVSVATYTDLNRLLDTKRNLVDDLTRKNVYKLESSKVVYDTSKVLNIKTSSLSYKVILPVLFFFIFVVALIIFNLFGRYHRKEIGEK